MNVNAPGKSIVNIVHTRVIRMVVLRRTVLVVELTSSAGKPISVAGAMLPSCRGPAACATYGLKEVGPGLR